MPRVWKSFTLPEEDYEYKRYVHAMDMFSFIWDFRETLRSTVKHNPNRLTPEQREAVSNFYDTFLTELQERGLSYLFD